MPSEILCIVFGTLSGLFLLNLLFDRNNYIIVFCLIISINIFAISYNVYNEDSIEEYNKQFEKYENESIIGEGVVVENKNRILYIKDENNNEIIYKTLNYQPNVSSLDKDDKIKFKYVKNKMLIIKILE